MTGFHSKRRPNRSTNRTRGRFSSGLMRFIARWLMPATWPLLPSPAFASASGAASLPLATTGQVPNQRPRGEAATELALTRYGTPHEVINVLEAVSSLDLRIGYGLAVFGVLPLSASYMDRNACCGRSLGNMTAGVRHRSGREARWLDLLASLSAPTAPGDGDASVHARFAATAAVSRDAGLYLPNVTTARLAIRASTGLGPHAWLSAGAGAHVWISREIEQPSRLLLPVGVSLACRFRSGTFGFVAVTTIYSLTRSEQSFVAATEAGVGYQASQVTISARLHVPVDQALRSLGAIGLGSGVQVSF